MVGARRRDDELAGLLLQRGVADVPLREHLDGHPERQVPHKLAALLLRRRQAAALADAPLEALGIARVHDDPVLGRAGVEEVERVQLAVLHVHRKRRRAAFWRACGRNVEVGCVDARVSACLCQTAAIPRRERQLFDAEVLAEDARGFTDNPDRLLEGMHRSKNAHVYTLTIDTVIVLGLPAAFQRFCKGGIVGGRLARASCRHAVDRHLPLALLSADDEDQVVVGRLGPQRGLMQTLICG